VGNRLRVIGGAQVEDKASYDHEGNDGGSFPTSQEHWVNKKKSLGRKEKKAPPSERGGQHESEGEHRRDVLASSCLDAVKARST